MTEKDKILAVSHDPRMTDVCRKMLENAGFEVLTASDSTAIRAACEIHRPRLVMIGYSLLPSEKRRAWAAVRERCEVPVLELYKQQAPELMSPDFFQLMSQRFFNDAVAPDDFVAAVMKLLSRGKRKQE